MYCTSIKCTHCQTDLHCRICDTTDSSDGPRPHTTPAYGNCPTCETARQHDLSGYDYAVPTLSEDFMTRILSAPRVHRPTDEVRLRDDGFLTRALTGGIPSGYHHTRQRDHWALLWHYLPAPAPQSTVSHALSAITERFQRCLRCVGMFILRCAGPDYKTEVAGRAGPRRDAWPAFDNTPFMDTRDTKPRSTGGVS